MWVRSLGQEDPLEKGMATHSSILALRIPWTEEPGGLKSIGLQIVGHNWSNLVCSHSLELGNDCSKDSYSSPMQKKWNESHSVVSDSCDPTDCSTRGFSVHGILQARTLEWVAISFSRGSSRSRNQTWVSCITGRFFSDWALREALTWYEGRLSYSFYN